MGWETVMDLQIECCRNVGVAYQGTKGHWEPLQIAMATTAGKQLGVHTHLVDDVHQAPRNEGHGDCGHSTVEND